MSHSTVENLDHCDFIALRNMIIRTHLQDLKDVTNNVHYENYRCKKLAGLGNDGKQSRMSNKYVFMINAIFYFSYIIKYRLHGCARV